MLDSREQKIAERDTMTATKPWEETTKEFVEGIKTLHGEDGSTRWRPGMMINGNDSVPLSSPSMADRPENAMMQTEYHSATSMNHVHVHQRPTHVGAGWGEWDYWTAWQSAGRRIDSSMLRTKNKYWNHDVLSSNRWADADPNNPPAPRGWVFPTSIRLDPIRTRPGERPPRHGDGKMEPRTLPAELEAKTKRQATSKNNRQQQQQRPHRLQGY
ncbi:hypothetical protein GGR51DRAFT_555872 [Nemania sp. FL0031]|nr:hypothetical protein GGR51DRAFT_555872 [Nemania sp. FL0031]